MLQDDLNDMAHVLGRRPSSHEEGMALIDDMVRNEPGNVLIDLVGLFGRIERRREYLSGPMFIEQAGAPFERLRPPVA